MDSSEGKFDSAISDLRADIVNGVYEPGRRLPSQAEVCGKFGVGISTAQRVYQTLAEEGFLRVGARRSGTFVSESPPHLCNYGIVIPSAEQWSRYYMAIKEAIKSVKTDDTDSFREYHISREVGSRGEVARLCRDMRDHRLAGLILGRLESGLVDLKGLLDKEQLNVPCVVLENCPQLSFPMVYADKPSFLDRAVEYLFSKNRRRIAHLCMDFSWTHLEEFEATLSQRGVEIRPYWIQSIPVGPLFRSASHLVNMMMQLEGDKRPDALIIHDDNLVEHAVAGLLAAGVKVPDELEVIAKCNFPSPASSAIPIKYLGSDLRLIMKECLRVIDMQRRGETPLAETRFPAMFENELAEEV